MSSPFPIPNLTSSPFPFPLPQQSQSQFQVPGQVSPSPLISNQIPTQNVGSGPIFAPSPLSQLISSTINNSNSNIPQSQNLNSTGLTPAALNMSNSNNNGMPISIPTPNFGYNNNSGITPNTSALLASVGVGIGNTNNSSINPNNNSQVNTNVNKESKEGLIVALNEVESLLNRIEVVLGEINDIQNRVFQGRLQGDEDRLIALHTEYNQTLQIISSLSTSNLISSLPLIPSSFSPSTSSSANPTDPDAVSGGNESTINQYTTNLSITDLANWSEERAGLEFSKKENLKAASKTVVDILRGSGR